MQTFYAIFIVLYCKMTCIFDCEDLKFKVCSKPLENSPNFCRAHEALMFRFNTTVFDNYKFMLDNCKQKISRLNAADNIYNVIYIVKICVYCVKILLYHIQSKPQSHSLNIKQQLQLHLSDFLTLLNQHKNLLNLELVDLQSKLRSNVLLSKNQFNKILQAITNELDQQNTIAIANSITMPNQSAEYVNCQIQSNSIFGFWIDSFRTLKTAYMNMNNLDASDQKFAQKFIIKWRIHVLSNIGCEWLLDFTEDLALLTTYSNQKSGLNKFKKSCLWTINQSNYPNERYKASDKKYIQNRNYTDAVSFITNNLKQVNSSSNSSSANPNQASHSSASSLSSASISNPNQSSSSSSGLVRHAPNHRSPAKRQNKRSKNNIQIKYEFDPNNDFDVSKFDETSGKSISNKIMNLNAQLGSDFFVHFITHGKHRTSQVVTVVWKSFVEQIIRLIQIEGLGMTTRGLSEFQTLRLSNAIKVNILTSSLDSVFKYQYMLLQKLDENAYMFNPCKLNLAPFICEPINLENENDDQHNWNHKQQNHLTLIDIENTIPVMEKLNESVENIVTVLPSIYRHQTLVEDCLYVNALIDKAAISNRGEACKNIDLVSNLLPESHVISNEIKKIASTNHKVVMYIGNPDSKFQVCTISYVKWPKANDDNNSQSVDLWFTFRPLMLDELDNFSDLVNLDENVHIDDNNSESINYMCNKVDMEAEGDNDNILDNGVHKGICDILNEKVEVYDFFSASNKQTKNSKHTVEETNALLNPAGQNDAFSSQSIQNHIESFLTNAIQMSSGSADRSAFRKRVFDTDDRIGIKNIFFAGSSIGATCAAVSSVLCTENVDMNNIPIGLFQFAGCKAGNSKLRSIFNDESKFKFAIDLRFQNDPFSAIPFAKPFVHNSSLSVVISTQIPEPINNTLKDLLQSETFQTHSANVYFDKFEKLLVYTYQRAAAHRLPENSLFSVLFKYLQRDQSWTFKDISMFWLSVVDLL